MQKVNVRLIGDKEFVERLYAIFHLFLDFKTSKARRYRSKKNPNQTRLYFTVTKPPYTSDEE